MPKKPSAAMAMPIVDGEKPIPPAKWKGRRTASCSAFVRGDEERKMDQRAVKPPSWKSIHATVRSVMSTFGVIASRKGGAA